jgi:membrane associated rhomboid family serine protease
MPTTRRTRDPARPTATARVPPPQVPIPERAPRLVTPSRVNRAWPAVITLIAFIVFTVARAQTGFVVALVAALAALAGGAILLTLMFGTAWIIRPRRRTPKLPQGR